MQRLVRIVGLAGAVMLLAACGSSGYSSGSSTSRSVSQTPTAAAAAATQTTAAQAQAATPATNPVERVSGTVQRVEGDRVFLQNGGNFTLTAQTAITRRVAGTAAALKAGQVVAVTARRQPDNTLLASLVMVFPAAPNGFPLGQRPLDGGNLMTNATVETVEGNGFTVTFPGGGARVSLAPDAQITVLSTGTPADITAGAALTASIRDGVAQTVSIQ